MNVRVGMRRFTRLTNAFSKKLQNHAYAVALHQMFYNFTRTHQTLRVTPAMAAGVTDRLWEMTDLVAMIEAWEVKEKRDARPIFEIGEQKIGGGYFVRATLANSVPEQIFGFATENEAALSITNESAAWLYAGARRSRLVRNKLGRQLERPPRR